MFSSRTRVSVTPRPPHPWAPAARPLSGRDRYGDSGSPSPRPGSTVSPAFTLAHDLGRVVGRERPDVAAVDRGHRGHVARAEALELADLDVLEALRPGLVGERVETFFALRTWQATLVQTYT